MDKIVEEFEKVAFFGKSFSGNLAEFLTSLATIGMLKVLLVYPVTGVILGISTRHFLENFKSFDVSDYPDKNIGVKMVERAYEKINLEDLQKMLNRDLKERLGL